MIERPNSIEYAPFYARYVSLVEGENLLETLESQKSQLHGVMKSIPHDRETFRYEPEKWSIREVFGHLTDAERVFGYRAFCISRGDQTPLPGFDEVSYMERSSYHGDMLRDLVHQFELLRDANLAVFRALSNGEWRSLGNANGSPVSVRALGYITAGHVFHHLEVLRSRYGVKV
jgi:hypothetical protein